MRSLSMRHVYGENNGYGYMGMSLHDAFERMGVRVEDLDESATGTVPRTVLFNQLPGHARGRHVNQKSVLFTMFETTQIPAEFAEMIGEYDTIVVPCEENARSFAAHHSNVKVVPLGVDPARWHYIERRKITPRDPFTFLIVGAGWKRKGMDDATAAFLQLRKEVAQPMRLICKMQDKEPLSDELPRDPDIVYLREQLSQEEEVALYADAHCFLAPSKGEGWGLCPHQAIAQGIPTILTDAAGHKEFSRYGIPISWHHEPAQYGIWEDTGDWWVPDFEALLEAMRYVFENYEFCVDVAGDQAENISYLTWDNTARLLMDVIDFGSVESGGWYEFKRKVYPIQVMRKWECNVGGQNYIFEPGQTYYDFADVKRICYNDGALDPRCPVEGLNRAQVEDRSARVYACPTCKRPYPTAEEFAEEVLGELQLQT